MSNPRKRRFSESGIDPRPVKKRNTGLIGEPFRKRIAQIEGPTSLSAFTQLSMPVRYRSTGKGRYGLSLSASYSAKEHFAKDGMSWVQGVMDMSGQTSYEAILPKKLSLQRVTFETRVMKKLALGEGYEPKEASFKEIPNLPELTQTIKNWGRIGMQSYLEDITARTALGIEDVGSGMRAEVLAAKLRMKRKGFDETEGFHEKMYERFPQLLTGDSTPKGGAAHYNNLIAGDHDREATTTQELLRNKVLDAHRDVNYEAGKRFKHKWKQIEAGGMTTDEAGKWWKEMFGANKSGEGVLGKRDRTIRELYVGNKLARHDITYFEE